MDYRHASPNTRWTMKRGNHDQRLYNAMVDNVRALHKVQAADDDIPALSRCAGSCTSTSSASR
jgi:hypothetical protein